MDNEDRFARSRERAAETSLQRARERQQQAAELSVRVASMGSVEANRQARRLNEDDAFRYMGPVSNPYEWSQAVTAARSVTIEAARLRQTVTYGELQIVVVETPNMKVGFSHYADLAMAVNEIDDQCLLSSIIVKADTGEPGDGFLPFARECGFEMSVQSMQRQVFDRFDAQDDRSSQGASVPDG